MERSQPGLNPKNAAGWLVLAMVLAPVVSARGQNPWQPIPTYASAKSHRLIAVSIPDRKLAVLQDGRLIKTFAISVGAAGSPSPVGDFQIVTRVTNPTYYHRGAVIAPGRGNPIGTRWMGLSRKGYGIHGTNEPGSIGKAASHGCIRLRNGDIGHLFAMVQIGDTVEIRGERDERIAEIFGGVVETKHTTLAQAQAPVVHAEQQQRLIGGWQCNS